MLVSFSANEKAYFSSFSCLAEHVCTLSICPIRKHLRAIEEPLLNEKSNFDLTLYLIRLSIGKCDGNNDNTSAFITSSHSSSLRISASAAPKFLHFLSASVYDNCLLMKRTWLFPMWVKILAHSVSALHNEIRVTMLRSSVVEAMAEYHLRVFLRFNSDVMAKC